MKILTHLSIAALTMAGAGCESYSSGPSPTAHLSGVTLPNQSAIYAAEQCIGAVVDGVCYGSVIGKPIGTCHSAVLGGRCLGVAAPDSAHQNRLNAQPRTYQEMMEQFRQPSYEEMMQNSNALQP